MLSFFEYRLEKSVDGLQSGHLASHLFPSSTHSRCASSYIFLGAPMCISSLSSDQRFQCVLSVLRSPTWESGGEERGGGDKGRMEQARDDTLLSSTQGVSHPGSQELPQRRTKTFIFGSLGFPSVPPAVHPL